MSQLTVREETAGIMRTRTPEQQAQFVVDVYGTLSPSRKMSFLNALAEHYPEDSHEAATIRELVAGCKR
ncbi:MAG: hypothetical protein KDI33_21435 [Halioglobus sp.]|nr:hypothetical protein [Halioglobus sp.]